MIYTKTDFDNAVDFTITTEDTGQNVWVESNVTASATKAPSQDVHDTVGVDTSVNDFISLVNERLKIVVANGGNVKVGAFRLIVA